MGRKRGREGEEMGRKRGREGEWDEKCIVTT